MRNKQQHQIGVILFGDTKARILKRMQKSGRTLSREAEYLILKGMTLGSNRRLAEAARRDLANFDNKEL